MSPHDFDTAFYHLSHHLYADGCPEPSLANVWPRPRAARRRTDLPVTTSAEALGSVKLLREYAVKYGLSMMELSAVACACHRMATAKDLASVLVNNKHHFLAVIKCLLPKQRQSIPRAAVSRLLSIQSTEERIIVIRFLTLSVQTGEWLAPDALAFLAGTYGYSQVFHFALQPASCSDAVRLLLRLTSTKHATMHRMRRLEIVMARHGDKVKPLSVLLGLIRGLQNDATSYVAAVDDATMPAFPDKEWEQNFLRGVPHEPAAKKLPSMLRTDLNKPLAYSGRLVELLSNVELQQRVLLSKSERIRLQSVLSTHLSAEWFNEQSVGGASLETKSQSRVEFLAALSSFVKKTAWMPREAEDFVVNVVLSNWDGTWKPFGSILCRDLLPFITLSSSLDETMRMLEPHILYGEGTSQVLILTALSDLVSQRCRGSTPGLDLSQSRAAQGEVSSSDAISVLAGYVKKLLAKGFLMHSKRNFLLQMAALGFHESLSDDGIATMDFPVLLLRSPSVTAIDRFCDLAIPLAPTTGGQLHLSEFAAGFLGSLRINDVPGAACRGQFGPTVSSLLFRDNGPTAAAAESDLSRALGAICGVEFSGYAVDLLLDPRSDGLRGLASGQESPDDFNRRITSYLHQCKYAGIRSFLLPFIASSA